eukprot:2225584-Amphidinium_carterae.3
MKSELHGSNEVERFVCAASTTGKGFAGEHWGSNLVYDPNHQSDAFMDQCARCGRLGSVSSQASRAPAHASPFAGNLMSTDESSMEPEPS